MFDFLKRKPTPSQSAVFITNLIRKARALPHKQNGNYVAFLIIVDCTASQFMRHLGSREGQAALIGSVEHRIMTERRFEDDVDEMVLQSRKYHNWVPNLTAQRVIMARNQPVCDLTVTIKDGETSINLEISDLSLLK